MLVSCAPAVRARLVYTPHLRLSRQGREPQRRNERAPFHPRKEYGRRLAVAPPAHPKTYLRLIIRDAQTPPLPMLPSQHRDRGDSASNRRRQYFSRRLDRPLIPKPPRHSLQSRHREFQRHPVPPMPAAVVRALFPRPRPSFPARLRQRIRQLVFCLKCSCIASLSVHLILARRRLISTKYVTNETPKLANHAKL